MTARSILPSGRLRHSEETSPRTVRTQFAEGLQGTAARSTLREGISPDSAATLFHAVLNGLQMQWVLDPDLDIVGPVTDFVRLLFDEDLGDE
ncbi:TetR family transcriptional regulator C-terminal domain-containing protein [Streptomyces bobili]|uniref:TetR family transcriptional regulator C-terminal domain-containing protein n=1 Tax=Streptomyces bobili TaxID=67280 RepID=UPI002250C0E1|nr:TetR family transcriptional regulator C-terminal domain-containing protein [Streptomyces bobili]MCX5521585.1 TetR family transcriptional regulator C-terminal domain-containing protein [Streptomyces bobili]